MSKKASKTLIGAFVLGAVALVVAGVVVFGSGKFFTPTKKFVMFFDGSVKGLNVGAPVIFRGVKIGQVLDMRLNFNPKDLTAVVPVYIEIDPRQLKVPEAFKPLFKTLEAKEDYPLIHALIEKGLKAQLQLQSFVTGQLIINLDFYPDKPLRLRGLEKKYPEIPTIPTTLEELAKTFEELPLKEITVNLNRALEGIGTIAHSPELKESIASLNQALKSIDRLAKDIDSQVGPLSSSVRNTSDAARGAFVQAEKTLALKEGVPGEIATGIVDTLKSARLALDEVQKTFSNVDRVAVQNANLGYEISRTVEQITALSRSLRVLSDYLEQHPEALIRGKRQSKGE
ncbi:MAG TPA: MlaD family protein [Thermodesulfovibrionales bacterium]|nr:MlaD family protein [Thermodesulfovibrionales bacterium]